MNTTTFFLMGCWNRLDCKALSQNKKEPRDQVLSYIVDYLNRNESLPMGIIAGDNYYHFKKKFEKGGKEEKHTLKIFRESTFEYLKCFIDQLTERTKLNMIPGNHDYPSKKLGMELSDSVYKRQKTLEKEGLSYHWENRATSIQTHDQMTFLFIDLYDNNLETNLNILKSELKNNVQKGQWIIYVAHEPLIAFVGKKRNKKYALMEDGKKRAFILKFIQEIESSKHLFLCADTHNFQINEIMIPKNNLHLMTVVAGTGGGDPDKPDSELYGQIKGNLVLFTDEETEPHQIYNIKTDVLHNPYGFCVLEQDGNKIKVIYESLERTSSHLLQYLEEEKQVVYSPLGDQEHNPKLDFPETECYKNIKDQETQFCQKDKLEAFSKNNSNLEENHSLEGGNRKKKTHKKKSRKISQKNTKKRRSRKKQKN